MYSLRPSELVGLEANSYVKYCFDQAVLHWGLHVEHELDKVTSSSKERREASKAETKRKAALEQLLDENKAKGGHFADPAAMFS